MRYTTETFIEAANKVFNNKYEYTKTIYNSKKKVIITCPIHKKDFDKRVDQHLAGVGCPYCASEAKSKRQSMPKEESIQKSIEKHGNLYDYSLLTNFTSQKEVYNIICKKHGSFSLRFDKHIGGRGCQKCSIEEKANKLRLPLSEVLEKIEKVHGDRYGLDNLNYKGANYKIQPTCKIHGDFKTTPFEFFNGSNCPYCAVKFSKAEIEIKDFVESFVDIEHSNRKILKDKFELDIYIPSLKVAIEYNGLYFHSDKFHGSKYHLNKTQECQEKGIKLVHIFEDEWIHKKEIVKSILLDVIGKTPTVINVEDCDAIKAVDHEEYKDFLEANHIEGHIKADVIVGLYYENELVATVGNSDFLTFCPKLNTKVIGGFEALLNCFSSDLTSFADLRWSQGEFEKNLGFKLVKQTKPKFFYTKGQVRTKTAEKAFNKIYDCGSLKLVKTK